MDKDKIRNWLRTDVNEILRDPLNRREMAKEFIRQALYDRRFTVDEAAENFVARLEKLSNL